MLSRITALLLFLGLPFASGCANCDKSIGRPAPEVKFCNFPRLFSESKWFYADVQDVIFGVDYYTHMEAEFGNGPYN